MSAFRKRLVRDGLLILFWPYLAVALLLLIAWIAENAELIDQFFDNLLRKLI
jgi:hypothetical protein